MALESNIIKATVYPIWATSGTTAASAALALTTGEDGFIKHIRITAPSTSADVSATYVVLDEDGDQLWTFGTNGLSSGLATAHSLTAADIPVRNGYIIQGTFNGAPGSAASPSGAPLTATVKVHLAR